MRYGISYRGAARSFLRALERSEEISTAGGVSKHGGAHHNNTPKEHKHGKPDAGADSFEEYVAWSLSKQLENLMNSYEKVNVPQRTRRKSKRL